MPDQVLIYMIVMLNALCQLLLIRRLKLSGASKWKYSCLAVAIPAILMVSMRLLIANGAIHGRIADQTFVEQYITKGASILLIAGPWFATIAAIVSKRGQRSYGATG